tara:strand:+ start:539 stop:1273 length:735 start_codon:yes stop_codon:yes gene_type:complete
LSLEPTIKGLENKKPEKLLYIGNSYLYYNDSLHNHVRRMLEELYSKEIDTTNYKSVTISGSRLPDHNIEYSLNNKNIGATYPFELVILQGGSGEADTINEREIFASKVKSMVKKIHDAGAEAALYMIHAYVEPHEKTNPQMIIDIEDMYVKAANENKILVMPVGIAFENAYKTKPNFNLHKDYDGTHPNLFGTYLASCIVFSSITHKSPLLVEYDYFGKISNEDKTFLQNIAHETIEDFFGIKL